ncbi:Predicted dehydrogenase [Friedmanniella luteola]|uniref:Predicted dehydrogenase n=1 Tax=Friedmanniella luteola TaxID=546871 RepID=A0A1H1L891_9ACTN|nr:Gfo/Idh/MocA family oxidoreductase [Friedmanniella luteola]SDR70703.1 Predicted dehydrogenase [Friedmanniella luteola]
MSEPLRLGVLGAARISDVSLLGPAAELGVRLVAVATRDRGRSEAYAREHGIERVHDSYADVIADPEVEAIYNPLPNSAHAPWNLAAIAARKHVLTEKPAASNAAEAARVHDAAAGTGLVVLEGFHYRYHPQFDRLAQIVSGEAIGDFEHLDVTMAMPAPDEDDLRWSWPLSGGAMMDLGCYCVHVIRSVAGLQGAEPTLVAATATQRAGRPQIDESFEAELRLLDGVPAFAHVDMAASAFTMTIAATGSRGSALFADFVHPHDDDRLLITVDGQDRVEHLDARSTYSYQLETFVAAIRDGRPFPTTTADTVATMELVDACYRTAGLLPRGTA